MRIFVFTKDVMVITGCSESYSRKIIRNIKEEFGKEKQDRVSYQELPAYLKIPTEDVINALKL